MNCQRI